MTRQPYQTKSGLTQFKPLISESEFLHLNEEYTGFCLACGEFAPDGVEPDARRYNCHSCQQPKVFGLEELLFMNLIVFADSPAPHP